MILFNQFKRQSKKLIENAKRIELEINTEKTEYMVVQRKVPLNNQNSGLEVEDHTFKRTKQFKYLGTILTQHNEINSEVKARIQTGNKCYFGLTGSTGCTAIQNTFNKFKDSDISDINKISSNLWVGNMDVTKER